MYTAMKQKFYIGIGGRSLEVIADAALFPTVTDTPTTIDWTEAMAADATMRLDRFRTEPMASPVSALDRLTRYAAKDIRHQQRQPKEVVEDKQAAKRVISGMLQKMRVSDGGSATGTLMGGHFTVARLMQLITALLGSWEELSKLEYAPIYWDCEMKAFRNAKSISANKHRYIDLKDILEAWDLELRAKGKWVVTTTQPAIQLPVEDWLESICATAIKRVGVPRDKKQLVIPFPDADKKQDGDVEVCTDVPFGMTRSTRILQLSFKGCDQALVDEAIARFRPQLKGTGITLDVSAQTKEVVLCKKHDVMCPVSENIDLQEKESRLVQLNDRLNELFQSLLERTRVEGAIEELLK